MAIATIKKMADEVDPSMLGIPNLDGQENQSQGEPAADGGQPDGGGEPQGGGDAPQTVKIGDKELTLDQVAELEKKARDYDALLPDYTKKSQTLAELNKKIQSGQEIESDKPFYMKKGWIPQSYEEIQQALVMAEERGLKRAIETIDGREQTKAEAQKQWNGFVENAAKNDKSFDKNAFAQFVVRHNLPVTGVEAIKSAYGVYKEVMDAKLGRAGGGKPASGGGVGAPKSGQPAPSGVPYRQIHNARSAYDLVQEMFQKK